MTVSNMKAGLRSATGLDSAQLHTQSLTAGPRQTAAQAETAADAEPLPKRPRQHKAVAQAPAVSEDEHSEAVSDDQDVDIEQDLRESAAG